MLKLLKRNSKKTTCCLRKAKKQDADDDDDEEDIDNTGDFSTRDEMQTDNNHLKYSKHGS